MRLWHQDLLAYLPRQQLLGQHRECCALRGMGWGKKHATVDYVFKYSIERLYCYHYVVMMEMAYRGYKVNQEWLDAKYRGKNIGIDESIDVDFASLIKIWTNDFKIYPEHNDEYLLECLNNLKNKGIFIIMARE